MDKVVCIIQARTGSTRLPGKILMGLFGKPVLEHVIDRVKQVPSISEIVIATTEIDIDTPIEMIATNCGIKTFRGSENDVLSRYYYAAKENNADIIVRITSDCPLIDPGVTDEIINYYLKHNYRIVLNAGDDLSQRTYPRGLDVEVFSFKELEEAFFKADKQYQREHVTEYIFEKNIGVYYYKNKIDYSKYRWTLDTKEDFDFFNAVYEYLYHGKHDFYFDDVICLMENHPELTRINAYIEQKDPRVVNVK